MVDELAGARRNRSLLRIDDKGVASQVLFYGHPNPIAKASMATVPSAEGTVAIAFRPAEDQASPRRMRMAARTRRTAA